MTRQHGGNIFGYENILDFSANINPLGTPDSVKRAIIDSVDSIYNYPDPYCTELCQKIAEREKTNAENIVCGNGADDLIFRIVRAFAPKKALIFVPSFSEYNAALSEVNCEICEQVLTEDNSFQITESMIGQLNSTFDICFVCTPNNPTGQLIQPEILKKLALKCKNSGILLICDECFLGFANESEKYSLKNHLNDSCIVLNAFTKLYAMPGIRLGYAVCGSTKAAEKIRNSGQFWSVSTLAQAAGTAALNETGYVCRTKEYVTIERHFLIGELDSLGLKVFDSAANFLLFHSVADLFERMLTENILIRDSENFRGLSKGFYRIAVRTHEENVQLIIALGRCLNG